MGSVKKRDNGKWRARYYDPNGKQRSKTFRLKEDADRFVREQEDKVARGEWLDPSRGDDTFAKVAARWKDTWVGLTPSTQHRYDGILRKYLLPAFGERRIKTVSHEMVQSWVRHHTDAGKVSPATVRRMFTVLRGVLKFAAKTGRISTDPTQGIVLPKVKKREMLYLEDAAQVHALADQIGERYRLLVLLAAYGGLRFGELAGLRVGRVDTMRGVLDVREALTDVNGDIVAGEPKSENGIRKVALPPTLRDLLNEHIAEFSDPTDAEALVFTTETGQPLRAASLHRRWKETVADVLPPHLHGLRFHDLRHTCAALLIAQGAHPKAISSRLGHANIGITMDTYGHLLPSVEEELVDGLDATFREAAAPTDAPTPLRQTADG